ncbi:MAG: class I SAM-dependent methyltransferase [Thermoanaerobaculia bacterium]|nr:class I SAM-dependent methyltransferase [Thermoanaerobaculia bacterium]
MICFDPANYWACAEGFEPPGFPDSRRRHLTEIENRHFWFPARRRLLASLLERHVPRSSTSRGAIELGCGTGDFLQVLSGMFESVVGVEAYGQSLAVAAEGDSTAVLIQSDATTVPLDSGQFDLVAALDVLEHVEPRSFLEEAARLAKPAGRLLVSVPAFPSLWSPLDEAAGHRCRYRLPDLVRQLAAYGWRVVHHTHYQALLFPVVWLARRFSTSRVRRLERRPSDAIAIPFGMINQLEVSLFGGLRLPWGSSLIVVAERIPTIRSAA